MNVIKRFSILIFITVFVFNFMLSTPVEANNHETFFIQQADMVVFPTEDKLKIVEVLIYVNNEESDHLEINIPENAKDFSIFGGLDQDKVKIEEDRLVYDGELPAGAFNVTFGYVIDLDNNSRASIMYKQPYWVGENSISVPAGKLIVNAQKFYTQSNFIELDGMKLRQFKRVNLQKNTDWLLSFQQSAFKQVTDEGSHSSEEKTKDGLPIIAHTHGGNPKEAFFNILFVILILVLGMISISYTSNKKQLKLKGQGKQLLEKEMILDELQRLEEQRNRNEITKEEFDHVFQLKYRRLKEIAIILEGEPQ